MRVGRTDRDVLYAACGDAGNEATTKHLHDATIARPHVTQRVEWLDVLECSVENETAVIASESVATYTLTCRYDLHTYLVYIPSAYSLNRVYLKSVYRIHTLYIENRQTDRKKENTGIYNIEKHKTPTL